MATTERVAEKIECVAQELLEVAKELRRGEGDWRWQPATLHATEAIRAQLVIDEAREPREPQTFEELFDIRRQESVEAFLNRHY